MIVGRRTRLMNYLTKPLEVPEMLLRFRRRAPHATRVVYIISMPRTGSTLVKRYLGDHPRIKLAGMSPSHNYMDAWILHRLYYPLGKIILDKRTKYIDCVPEIVDSFGKHVRILVLVRDPRDQLLSLLETQRHPAVPRDIDFWNVWHEKYHQVLQFLEQTTESTQSVLLRYEDLVLHPVEIKRLFLAWIGLDIVREEAVYHNTRSDIADQDNLTEDWKCHQTNIVHQDSLQKWSRLDENSVHWKLVNSFEDWDNAVQFMKLLGYMPRCLTDPSKEVTSIDILAPSHENVHLLGGLGSEDKKRS